jgi:hypothetical protein
MKQPSILITYHPPELNLYFGQNSCPIYMYLEVGNLVHSTYRFLSLNEKWVAKPLLIRTGIQTTDLQDLKPMCYHSATLTPKLCRSLRKLWWSKWKYSSSAKFVAKSVELGGWMDGWMDEWMDWGPNKSFKDCLQQWKSVCEIISS